MRARSSCPFDNTETALRIVRAVRRLRSDVPVLVRTEDDSKLDALQAAGATEVIPETFETSLSLVAHVLLFLDVPAQEVLETTEGIRHDRYAILRSVFRKRDAPPPRRRIMHSGSNCARSCCRRAPTAWGAPSMNSGSTRARCWSMALRRDGIVGRDPDPDTRLREGDVVMLWGTPEDLEQGESRLLMG